MFSVNPPNLYCIPLSLVITSWTFELSRLRQTLKSRDVLRFLVWTRFTHIVKCLAYSLIKK